MTDVVQIRSTSRNTAVASDIILREGPLVRLIFRPLILNNPNNPGDRVKGTFIYQRKLKSAKWEDYNEGSLQQVKSGEGISLQLKSSELHKLLEELPKLYDLAEQHGIVLGDRTFTLTSSNVTSVISQISENPEYLTQVVEKNGWGFLQESLQWLAKNITTKDDQKRLLGLNQESLGRIDAAVSMVRMQSTLELLEKSMAIEDEGHWQNLLMTNPWLLSQLFPYPVVLLQDKAYVGGKALDNTHGNIVDFLYQNKMTENSILIEIKHPGSLLLGGKYRNNSFSMTSDLTGGISQLLSYRDSIMKESAQIIANTRKDLRIYYPKCVLVIGNYAREIDDDDKIASFERFRASLNWLEIVTFDELLNRIKGLLSILDAKGSNKTASPLAPKDELPF